ncbi:carbohydrate-binding protein [Streptomyces sp. NPDC015220]|uniref:carbohydrate-binding protein n=1 Tax=Streptomyces sp. NPDC015220 TaxID=3364947 RepID=UPI0036F89EE0
MLHRHTRAACAAAAATGALVLAGLSGTASAGTTASGTTGAARSGASAPSAAETLRTADTSAAVLHAMQRDLGIDRQQAERRLSNEAAAGATAGRLRNALGADFAGAWVHGADSGTLTVATTDAADVAAIEARGAVPAVVEHSLASLDAAKARLDRAAAHRNTTDTPVWYVDVRTNTLVIQAVRPDAARSLLSAAGVAPSLAKVVKSAERPRPLYDLRGGDAYYINGNTRCSIGFPITRGTQQGFASAGHCGRAGSSTTGSNQVAQGTFQASVFPGNDMSWVAANSNWTATPYVNQSGQNLQVTGSTVAAVGSSVCRSGSTTGWHCGTVQQLNSSVTYQEGTVSGVTRTSVCAEPGDSGGSFISGSQAQGVTSGGTGDCTSGGTTYFQPINPILSSYGLTLKTTTDNPGPGDPGPGNPGGTWAAGTVYQAGDTVTYGGATYRCLQAHQAQPGWEPPNVPALWQRA